MARRPTVADIAREAGVGVATVDRVLNGRAAVRPETGRRVLEAARAIGYHGAALLKRRLDESVPQYRLGFLLQRREQPFYQSFGAAMETACAAASEARLVPEVAFLRTQEPAEIAPALLDMAGRVQAIAMVAIDHPIVSAAVAEVEAAGTPVFSLLSDFAVGVRHGYIGLNNRKVGRTSAWLLSRCVGRPAKVAIFVGSHRFHGHEEREIGFRSYLRESAPQVEVIETQASLEDRAVAHEAVIGLLRRHPDLRGIYIAGGGMEGAIAALREESEPGKVAVVCSELTDGSRAALADNVVAAVVTTPLDELGREITSAMVTALSDPAAPRPGQTFLPFNIYISENI
jgi:LacI family transcriptional regulator